MRLELKRIAVSAKSTIGSLSIDGKLECYTLEDTVREVEGEPVAQWKVQNETAIPRGTYQVIIDYSVRFRKDLPHVLGVPGFSGIRIHPGNCAADTEGCILVGQLIASRPDWVGNSRQVFVRLMQRLESAYDRGDPITLTIS